jgi:ERCC4-type nuclease
MNALDDREHGLRPLLPQEDFPFTHLPVGDIWIAVDSETKDIRENGLIIERKSVADLEASILDGRYREQRSRLLSYSSEKKAHPIYIIEGDLNRTASRGWKGMDEDSLPLPLPLPLLTQTQTQTKQFRLQKPALMKHLTRLALRYHITLFQTASLKETAELCQLLAEQWKADPTTFAQPKTMTYIETRGKTRQENSDDPKVFATSVIQCCRGISATGAQAILAAFGSSLKGVWEATQDQLAAVQIGKQKLGQVKAERLYSLLHT